MLRSGLILLMLLASLGGCVTTSQQPSRLAALGCDNCAGFCAAGTCKPDDRSTNPVHHRLPSGFVCLTAPGDEDDYSC